MLEIDLFEEYLLACLLFRERSGSLFVFFQALNLKGLGWRRRRPWGGSHYEILEAQLVGFVLEME